MEKAEFKKVLIELGFFQSGSEGRRTDYTLSLKNGARLWVRIIPSKDTASVIFGKSGWRMESYKEAIEFIQDKLNKFG